MVHTLNWLHKTKNKQITTEATIKGRGASLQVQNEEEKLNKNFTSTVISYNFFLQQQSKLKQRRQKEKK